MSVDSSILEQVNILKNHGYSEGALVRYDGLIDRDKQWSHYAMRIRDGEPLKLEQGTAMIYDGPHKARENNILIKMLLLEKNERIAMFCDSATYFFRIISHFT